MTYRFLSPAEQDLAKAAEYYERAARGLGLEFIDELERTVGRILAGSRRLRMPFGQMKGHLLLTVFVLFTILIEQLAFVAGAWLIE